MRIPIITGPTATGKTNAAIKLAEKYDIEIINADAYQVYKYMDIGTAKPDKHELEAIPHHLIDILDPKDTYSVGDFFNNAQAAAKDIISRGKLPVIVGGTGMYVETLEMGIFEAPSRDDAFRDELRATGEEKGYDFLYNELVKIDPEFAAGVHENDKTRIIRGLEINKTLGMNVGQAHKKFHRHPDFEYDIFVLTAERNLIYERINERVIKMFEAGWAHEVRSLLEMGYDETLSSFKAIGYRDICSLINGELTEKDTISTIQKKTRNFAKRQLTWFRHMEGIKYIDFNVQNAVKYIVQTIETNFNSNLSKYK